MAPRPVRAQDLEDWSRETLQQGPVGVPSVAPEDRVTGKGFAAYRLRTRGYRVSWDFVRAQEEGQASLWKAPVYPRHLGGYRRRRPLTEDQLRRDPSLRPLGRRSPLGLREFRVKDPQRPLRGATSEVGHSQKPLVGCSILCSGNNTLRTVWHTKRGASALVRERGKTGQLLARRQASRASSWFGVESIYRNRPGSNSVIAAKGQRQPLFTLSAGRRGRTGARRGTTYASETVGRETARRCLERNRRVLHVILEGKRSHLTAAVRGLRAGGVRIASLRFVVKTPHGGCRPKKARRL